jgi:predicted Zn finger-like uncharacterized protein
MLNGEIVNFLVTAKCPHCTEETAVTKDELGNKEVDCQHCDKSFLIDLNT